MPRCPVQTLRVYLSVEMLALQGHDVVDNAYFQHLSLYDATFVNFCCITVLLAGLQVARTSDRPLACGEISQFRALTFLALPLSVSLGILLTFNWNT